MSVMDKFLKAIQLNGDDESGYYDSDDGYYDSSSKSDSLNTGAPVGKDDPSIDVSEYKAKKPIPKVN